MYAQADRSQVREMAEILEHCVPCKVTQKYLGRLTRRKRNGASRRESTGRSSASQLLIRCWLALASGTLPGVSWRFILSAPPAYYRERRLAVGRLNFTDLLISARDLLKNSREARELFRRKVQPGCWSTSSRTRTRCRRKSCCCSLPATLPEDRLDPLPNPKAGRAVRGRRPQAVDLPFPAGGYNHLQPGAAPDRRKRRPGGQSVVEFPHTAHQWSSGSTAGSSGLFTGGESTRPNMYPLVPARARFTGGAVDRLHLDETGSLNNSRVHAVEPRDYRRRRARYPGLMPRLVPYPTGVMVLTWKKKEPGPLRRRAGPSGHSQSGFRQQRPGLDAAGAAALAYRRRLSANPDDPVALVAASSQRGFRVQRSGSLYARVRAGLKFDWRESAHGTGIEPDVAARYESAFGQLDHYARWLEHMPPVAALELIATDLGLFAQAAGSPGGNQRAGGLSRALELISGRERARDSLPAALEILRRLASGELEADSTEARHAAAGLSPSRVSRASGPGLTSTYTPPPAMSP